MAREKDAVPAPADCPDRKALGELHVRVVPEDKRSPVVRRRGRISRGIHRRQRTRLNHDVARAERRRHARTLVMDRAGPNRQRTRDWQVAVKLQDAQAGLDKSAVLLAGRHVGDERTVPAHPVVIAPLHGDFTALGPDQSRELIVREGAQRRSHRQNGRILARQKTSAVEDHAPSYRTGAAQVLITEAIRDLERAAEKLDPRIAARAPAIMGEIEVIRPQVTVVLDAHRMVMGVCNGMICHAGSPQIGLGRAADLKPETVAAAGRRRTVESAAGHRVEDVVRRDGLAAARVCGQQRIGPNRAGGLKVGQPLFARQMSREMVIAARERRLVDGFPDRIVDHVRRRAAGKDDVRTRRT